MIAERGAAEYYDPEVQGALAGLMIRFLDERLAYLNAKDEEAVLAHEERAQAMLTSRYSAHVRDIGSLDVPNQTSPDGSLELATQRWETDSLSASRASMPVRWVVGGELVIRRFHFQRVAGEWKISGIEPLTRDPQPSNYLGPDER